MVHSSQTHFTQQELQKLREKEWQIYHSSYQKFGELLNAPSQDKACKTIFLKDLCVNQEIQKFFVDPQTVQAQMTCVDEATVAGEYQDELDSIHHSTITNHSRESEYILNFPGSGALSYLGKTTDFSIKHGDIDTCYLQQLDEQSSLELAIMVVDWCQHHNIQKFTVTYHDHCGAVAIRKSQLPESKPQNELSTAKLCAQNLARKISKISKIRHYQLQVGVGFIDQKQMCHIRPAGMHNALGTLIRLDFNLIPYSVDKILGFNLFDVFVYSDVSQESLEKSLELPTQIIKVINDSLNSIELTYQISHGEHGWGPDFFTPKNPYYLIFLIHSELHIQIAKYIESKLASILPSKDIGAYSTIFLQT